ncbi:hypothetical protein CERZMDRAFT_112879 [Cercospora zeae-maydis SCOH1-5]|uniref:non-specific serine/threonine protein kinase n=1 Tax=Cercospora zeae-maydis SCOH1-5 TaxID=717836 RepID=A0A6A6FCL1_9PEZI|nr:hypothetical protein CERZMDRAFT_112879 [Cercospora zeae-maydis SCOH1-5]
MTGWCPSLLLNALLESSVVLEEETVRGYRPEHYYPVQIGDLFHDRYRVVGKLGYGSASTVWLCHDLQKQSAYVALKVYINSSKKAAGPLRHGHHTCLVHEAAGMNFEELRELVPDETFEPDLIRQSVRSILRGMHFLHSEARVIHTDIQPKNILLGTLDDSAFARFERDEREKPLPRKELPDRTIYISHPMPLTKGPPLLCDLSEARFAQAQNTDLIMPDLYRAPEVILGMHWSYSVDLWGFAMSLWDLFEPKRLFLAKGDDGRYSELHHVAQMVAIMGPPPMEYLQHSERWRLYWDDQGRWKGAIEIPDISLESAEQRLHGEEKVKFLALMRKMLQWRPEDRSSIQDVYVDDWLFADLISSGEVVHD